jgi:hypothetical protein
MRVLLDARCTSCNHIDEVFGRRDDTFRCTICQSESKAIISPVKCHLDGTDPSFPGAYGKWARDHEKAAGKR